MSESDNPPGRFSGLKSESKSARARPARGRSVTSEGSVHKDNTSLQAHRAAIPLLKEDRTRVDVGKCREADVLEKQEWSYDDMATKLKDGEER